MNSTKSYWLCTNYDFWLRHAHANDALRRNNLAPVINIFYYSLNCIIKYLIVLRTWRTVKKYATWWLNLKLFENFGVHHGQQNHFLKALYVAIQTTYAIKSYARVQCFRLNRNNFGTTPTARFEFFILRMWALWRLAAPKK